MVSGVEFITIGEGVIAYQREEGFVPEGSVEALCGDDGRWSPDLTQDMCSNVMTTTTTATTATTAAASTTGMIRVTCPRQGMRSNKTSSYVVWGKNHMIPSLHRYPVTPQ